MLFVLVHDYELNGVGVDMSQLFFEQAKLRADELSVTDQINDDAAGYIDAENVDVVACVCAMWIGGGVACTIELPANGLRTGGITLIGDIGQLSHNVW
jgi:hypothetical protein